MRVDLIGKAVDLASEVRFLLVLLFNLGAGVNHGGVVPAAKVAANLFQTVAGQGASKVHAYLTRQSDTLTAFLGHLLFVTYVSNVHCH